MLNNIGMALPSRDEFVEALRSLPLEQVVRDYVFHGDTFFFQPMPADLEAIKAILVQRLQCQQADITVVGSAKHGFSTDPENFPRAFTPGSDIDLVVVHADLFDQFWQGILKWHYAHGLSLGKAEADWATARKNEVFWGWLDPGEISYAGLLERHRLTVSNLQTISHTWFSAFKSLSRVPSVRGRVIGGRLYRTWDHALRYHVMGLQKIKIRLQRNKAAL
jgi:hypothetical protein